jgi:two-component system sensor histidine kinase RpfC
MERMRAAAAAGDVAAFRAQAHAMRSSAANFGAVELCRLCLPWQTISGEDLACAGGAYVKRLEAEVSRAEAALLSWDREGVARG